jgi:ketosteroid isomerase-like protein
MGQRHRHEGRGQVRRLYADDATLLMPNAPALNGKEAIRAALKPMLADSNFSLTFQNTRAESSKGGDIICIRRVGDGRSTTAQGVSMILLQIVRNGLVDGLCVQSELCSDAEDGGDRP